MSLHQPLFFTNDIILLKGNYESSGALRIIGFSPDLSSNNFLFGESLDYNTSWNYGFFQQLTHVDDYHFIDMTNFRRYGSGHDLYIVWEINSDIDDISIKISKQILRIGNP